MPATTATRKASKKRDPDLGKTPAPLIDVHTAPQGLLLKLGQVLPLINVSVPTLYRWISEDRFPAPVHPSPGTSRWPAGEVRRYLESLKETRGR